MHLMPDFCLNSQKTKGLVHIVIAYILLTIDSYNSRHPAAKEKDRLYAEYGSLKKRMREYDAARENIENLLKASEDGTITAAQATETGLHRSVLQEFVKSGEMYRFGRGLCVAKYTMPFPRGGNAPSLKQENLIIKRVVPESYEFVQTHSSPAIQFVFTLWDGRCVTSCVALVIQFLS